MSMMEFKCPNCGGSVTFDSDEQQMVCPYCDAVFGVEELSAAQGDLDQQQAEETATGWDATAAGWSESEQAGLGVYTCNSCGGEIVGDETLGSMSCPFCGSPIVLTSHFSGMLRPDVIIPFKLDKKAAKEALKAHYKGKILMPKVFKDENHIDEVKGIYVPFWLFDAGTDARVQYSAEKVRRYSDSQYDYTEISYYQVLREGGVHFANVPVDGSSAMPDELMESIEPYDNAGMTDFQTAYLAGYFANKYDVDSQKAYPRARERFENSTEAALRQTVVGYTSVSLDNMTMRTYDERTRYALMPVWMLATSWNGEHYTFAMNGQTGKIVGNLPMDKGAFARWLLGLFGIFTAVGIGIVMLMQYMG